MFSGIVEEIGTVQSLDQGAGLSRFCIKSTTSLQDTKIGDSIAVNGTCLTVIELSANTFSFEAIPETLKLSNLGLLKAGSTINLERSITPLTRIGGHFVQGHIDGTTLITKFEPEGDSIKAWFKLPTFHRECFIQKGFISVDGMSLTLVDVNETEFSICFIPHTQKETIVKFYHVGTIVNVELDNITKTVVQIMNGRMSHGEKHQTRQY